MVNRKVIITGSFGVGKTSLFNRFVHNQFSEKYLTTIGVKVDKKVVTVQHTSVALLLWDIAGEVSQDKIPLSYFLGASGVIYVTDLSRPITFQNMEADITYLKNKLPKGAIKIVGNKKDLLSKDQLAHIHTRLPMPCDFLTSAKTGESVEAVFMSIANDLL